LQRKTKRDSSADRRGEREAVGVLRTSVQAVAPKKANSIKNRDLQEIANPCFLFSKAFAFCSIGANAPSYLFDSSTATATATVIPTIGLLPAPIRPIISTH